ncbi:MAG: Holliday junction branch migration protein RuvA [Lachnospiraceae bacterium]|nr:Holliday junction branch migration protein RuvA [Lachnospiraceae bacterium]
MIAYIRGIIYDIEEDAVILDQQGIGYRIYSSAMDLNQLSGMNREVTMHIHMSVREDDVSLYGFLTKEELWMYELLISVSGIGPKAGLSILSVLTVKDLQMAIISGDAKAITQANGVGMKGAQRVIMELKDKIDLESMLTRDTMEKSTVGSAVDRNPDSDVITNTALALTALGYSQLEAARAIREVAGASSMSEEELLKQALKQLL